MSRGKHTLEKWITCRNMCSYAYWSPLSSKKVNYLLMALWTDTSLTTFVKQKVNNILQVEK